MTQLTFVKQFEKITLQFPNFCALEIKTIDNKIKYYTYKELNHYSNTIAKYLLKLNIKRADFVGVCLEKSLELYAVILALFKIGAVYVPLSPNLSKSDFEYMLTDSGIKKIITTKKLTDKFQIITKAIKQVITIKNINNLEPAQDQIHFEDSALPCEVDPCYLIYTSGTTGKPKGILLPNMLHRPANFTIKKTLLNESDKCLQFSDIRTDVHLIEITVPWSIGASLVATDKKFDVLLDELGDIIQQTAVTFAIFPPTVLKELIKNKSKLEIELFLAEKLNTLSTLIAATEELLPEIVEQWRYRGKTTYSRKVYNGYGSTEEVIGVTTVCTSIATNSKVTLGNINEDIFDGLRVFIYRNNGYYKDGQGELIVVGHGMAICYWNNPRLTNTAFIEINDPENLSKKVRAYKTGDLVTIDQKGDLYFDGRIIHDRQVEISGNRIELSGVERKLKKHPSIKNAVVKKWGQRLIAYLVLDETRNIPNPKDLRNYILNYNQQINSNSKNNNSKISQFELTDYNSAEVPARYYIVSGSDLPGINSGEFVPKPEQNLLLKLKAYAQPTYQEEFTVKKIWEETFDYTPISIDADFYEIGGYSLLLTEIIKKIENLARIKIKASSLTMPITIASMAKHLFLQIRFNQSISCINSSSFSVKQPMIVFIPPLAGIANKPYEELFTALSPQFDQKINGFTSVAPLMSSKLEAQDKAIYLKNIPKSIDEIAVFSANAIEGINENNQPVILIGWSWGGILAYAIAKELTQKNCFVITLDSQIPGDLERMELGKFKLRLISIIKSIARSNNCEHYTIGIEESVHSDENKSVIISKLFNHVLQKLVATSDNGTNKFYDMLHVAYANTIAALAYNKTNSINLIISFIAKENSADKISECKINGWRIFADNFKEYLIDDANHFNITESKIFRKYLLTTISELIELANLQGIESKLKNNFFSRKRQSEIQEGLARYVQPTFLLENSIEHTIYNVIDKLANFNKRKIIFIHSVVGAGKTLLSHYIENYFWAANNFENNNQIAIYIPTHKIASSDLCGYVERYLQEQLKFDIKQIDDIRSRAVILIFDCNDQIETDNFTNLFTSNNLFNWNANILILTRSEFLSTAAKQYFSRLCSQCNLEFFIFKINSLSILQQDDYVKRYMKIADNNNLFYQFKQLLNKHTELSELTQNPLYLKFLCDYLNSNSLLDEPLINIIDSIVHEYFKKEYVIYSNYSLAFSFDEFLHNCKSIAQVIAIIMLYHNIDCIELDRMAPVAKFDSWNDPNKHGLNKIPIVDWQELIKNDPITRLLVRHLPLNAIDQINKELPYILKIYFTCNYIITSSTEHNFITSQLARKHKAILTPALFQSNQLLLSLMRDAYKKIPNWKNMLFYYIEKSKLSSDAETINAASCAIVLLNAFGISFSGKNLSNIHVSDIVLPNVIFTDANLMDAHFSNATLPGAKIDNAFLKDVTMENVTFGFNVFNFEILATTLIYIPIHNKLLAANVNEIALFNLSKKHITHHWRSHGGYITKIRLTPINYFIATADSIGYVYIWNSDNGKMINRWRAHEAMITDIQFINKGKNIITVGLDKMMRIWNLAQATCISEIKIIDVIFKILTDKNYEVNKIYYYTKNLLIAHDLNTNISQILFDFGNSIIALSELSNSSKHIAIITKQGTLQQWTINEGLLVFNLDLNLSFLLLEYTADDKTIIAIDRYMQILSIDGKTGAVRIWYQGCNNGIAAVCYMHNLKQLALLDNSRNLFIHDDMPFLLKANEIDRKNTLIDVRGNHYAYLSNDQISILIYGKSSNNNVITVKSAAPIKWCYLTEHKSIITISLNNYLSISSTDREVNTLFSTSLNFNINAVFYARESDKIYLLSSKYEIFTLDLMQPYVLTHVGITLDFSYASNISESYQMCVSNYSLTAVINNYLQIWDIRSLQKLYHELGDFSSILYINEQILVTSHGMHIDVWNIAENGKHVHSYYGHQARITCMAFSNESKLLASADCEGNINVWDINTAQNIKSISCSLSSIQKLFFNKNELNIQQSDNTISRWKLLASASGEKQWQLAQTNSRKFSCKNVTYFRNDKKSNLTYLFTFFNDNTRATSTYLTSTQTNCNCPDLKPFNVIPL